MSTAKLFGLSRLGVNGAMPRSLGKPPAQYPNQVATDATLKTAVDRFQTSLASPLDAVSLTMTVANAAGIVANMLLSIDNEIVSVTGPPVGTVVPISRGFDGTTPATHLGSALVSGFIDAWHHNAVVAEIEAIETALGPNLMNLPGAAFLVSSAFIFSPQTPGGSLIAGANPITLSPVPKGVNGTDSNHYLYISGGTGTAEPALIVGGSAVAGAASGTLIVQCAFAHSGAWTIQTASGGIAEALVAATGGLACVYVPAGLWTIYGPVQINSGCSIFGCRGSHLIMGANCQNFFKVPVLGMIGNATANYHDITIDGLEVDGNAANNGSVVYPGPPELVYFGGSTCNRVRVRNCYIHDYCGNGQGGGALAGYTPSSGGYGNEFTGNVLYSAQAIAGGFITTVTTVIMGNQLLPPGTGKVWGDAGLTLNGIYCFDSIIANNTVAGATVNIEVGAYSNLITGNVIDCNGATTGGGPAAIPVLSAGENNVISNNMILNVGSGSNGIQLLNSAPNSIVISNNFFTMLSGAGFKIVAPTPLGNWLIQEFGLVGDVSISLGNGANQNIGIGAPTGTAPVSTSSRLVSIVGPSAAFSIGGIVPLTAGCTLTLLNLTSAQMTININDPGSAASNRIVFTPTLANVNCKTCTLIYHGSSWSLVSSA